MISITIQQVIAALGGAIAGGAVSGIADHFAYNRSLWPFPVCHSCGAATGPGVWLPLGGPALAQRRCSACAAPGQWWVTFAAQVVCAALAVALLNRYGLSLRYGCAVVEALCLVTIAVTDFRHRLIPSFLVYPGLLFALASSPVWPNLGILHAALGAAAGFGCFAVLAVLARVMFGDGALGDGDVTLAAMIGAICGFPTVVFALAVGALAGGVAAMGVLVARRSALGSTIPYGPYLVLGILYVLLAGNTTNTMYTVF